MARENKTPIVRANKQSNSRRGIAKLSPTKMVTLPPKTKHSDSVWKRKHKKQSMLLIDSAYDVEYDVEDDYIDELYDLSANDILLFKLYTAGIINHDQKAITIENIYCLEDFLKSMEEPRVNESNFDIYKRTVELREWKRILRYAEFICWTEYFN
jgi:hypothetical protein